MKSDIQKVLAFHFACQVAHVYEKVRCSGQMAALAGGTTMVIDFALPIDHDLEQGFKVHQRKSKHSVMDYAFHMAVTRFDKKVYIRLST